jgi:hypothetical protein
MGVHPFDITRTYLHRLGFDNDMCRKVRDQDLRSCEKEFELNLRCMTRYEATCAITVIHMYVDV